MTRLVQLQRGNRRCVALVEEPNLRLLAEIDSIFALVNRAIVAKTGLVNLVTSLATGEKLAYDPIYDGESDWKLLPAIDHPEEPARCLVSGTGLTHLGSAKNRNTMHGKSEAELTDSMKMFRLGLDGGRPPTGKIGVAPEWFYKGVGTILRANGEPLSVPGYAEDGGEEAEIAGVYFIDPEGRPVRVGMTCGNEFSDHKFEKRNYLNLAGSKIRSCSIGPELVIDPAFDHVPGTASLARKGRTYWTREIATGENEMCHSLANIEHHHFKFETHRRPGDLHVHYYGACALSFGEGIELADGDVMSVQFAGFGRALRNPLRIAAKDNSPFNPFPHMNPSSSFPSIAFLGLGIMGSGMTRRLLDARFPLTVYNRNPAKAAPLGSAGARIAASPHDAVANARIVISMVADDAAARAVWLGEKGALAGVTSGTVCIECSTVSVGWVRELAAAVTARGGKFLDAPVTGSRMQAAQGELNFLVGGSPEVLETVRPVLSTIGKSVNLIGPTGSGALIKLINNFVCGVQVAALAEAIAMIERGGLDRTRALEVLTAGAPGSPLVKTVAGRMTQPDYTPNFLLRLMLKDLTYARQEASGQSLSLTTASAAWEVFNSALQAGLGEKDMAAVVEPLRSR